jgi:hypothetical protein
LYRSDKNSEKRKCPDLELENTSKNIVDDCQINRVVGDKSIEKQFAI